MTEYIKLGKLANDFNKALQHAQGRFNFNIEIDKNMSISKFIEYLNNEGVNNDSNIR